MKWFYLINALIAAYLSLDAAFNENYWWAFLWIGFTFIDIKFCVDEFEKEPL